MDCKEYEAGLTLIDFFLVAAEDVETERVLHAIRNLAGFAVIYLHDGQ